MEPADEKDFAAFVRARGDHWMRLAVLLAGSPSDKGVSAVRYEGPASGTGWTGTSYSFTANPTKEFPTPKVSGTVSVDLSGRVRKLVTTTPIGPNRGHMTTSTEIMTFGGFGITVSVTPPPPSEVYIDR